MAAPNGILSQYNARIRAFSPSSEKAFELAFLQTGNYGCLDPDNDKDYSNSPLFTREAYEKLGNDRSCWKFKSLFGSVKEVYSEKMEAHPSDPHLYLNLTTPFSGVICGVQGSGKSHSLSVALESSFMSHPAVGRAPAPLSGLAFHYGSASFGSPCEAAYLGTLTAAAEQAGAIAPKVTVLVSPSSLQTMEQKYSNLPHVGVKPLRLAPTDLNAARMMSLMSNDDSGHRPLYMESILAKIRTQGSDGFDYNILRSQIEQAKKNFNEAQCQMLNLRLELLDSFVLKTLRTSVKENFKAGSLVIVDLSDPYIGEGAACTLFDIMLGLFLEADTGCKGKIIALDEAHSFLTSDAAKKLTDSLLNIIRLQRHLGVRTLISTQEPTCVPPAILDLASFILAHRFSSPAWASHLEKHVSMQNDKSVDWFDTVASLRTGEACLFAPDLAGLSSNEVVRLGRGFMKVVTRPRLTSDGGRSVMAL